MRFAVICAAALLAGGCRYRPTPVPLAGDRSSISSLAGSWTGTYRGTESGREGTIVFTVQVTADSAFGDVLMSTPPGVPLIQPADDPKIHRMHSRGATLLAVRLVNVIGNDVEGLLEPYVAPDCDCTVVTKFTGRVIADTIRGTFVTRGKLIAEQTGVWAIVRTK